MTPARAGLEPGARMQRTRALTHRLVSGYDVRLSLADARSDPQTCPFRLNLMCSGTRSLSASSV
jgi:hypothetical protein